MSSDGRAKSSVGSKVLVQLNKSSVYSFSKTFADWLLFNCTVRFKSSFVFLV